MKYFILLWTIVLFFRILMGKTKSTHYRQLEKQKRFLFCIEKLEQTNKKKRNEMLTGRTKWWNQGQWNILFFSEQMFYFVGFSVGKKQLLTKSSSKPNVFLFLFRKTWTDIQAKKQRNEMLTRRTKKLQNGKIRVNEICYSSLNNCSILPDSQGETKSSHYRQFKT